MCYILYAGAGRELPLSPPLNWDELRENWPQNAPLLIVESLNEEAKVIRRHLAEAHIVYVGSFEGCGCGFNRCTYDADMPDDDEEDILSVKSRKALSDYVKQHGVSTLYGCWDGDQELPCEGDVSISPQDLADQGFELPERTRMRIVKT